MKQSSSLSGGGINRFKNKVEYKEKHLEKGREDLKMDFHFSRQRYYFSRLALIGFTH